MSNINRKQFLKNLSVLTGMSILSTQGFAADVEWKKTKMKLGLVTYQWGKDWDVPTLIKNCTDTKIHGVELRVEHAHKVMPELTAAERREVKKKFADSPVQIVGLGTNQQYDYPDQDKLRASIERTKEFIRLGADIGGSGVKVKPNALHKDVPVEKTLEQIGKSLNELARYASDFGQQLRLEVHGQQTQELPNIKKIMDYADHPNATICWNCNKEDLNGEGFQSNFDLVKKYFGDTCHVRELSNTDYPYTELLNNLAKMNYKGWVLLECHTNPDDKIKSMREQRAVFDKMVAAIG
ncbi:sugar phosphate isomerase/epimerase family protein [Dyadobacter bucti]|uniref:sugar phosphate isomerase/epimerase family protein n=1 Tax=Dyadobacter bucti TaxID=2572203 RepID=UPI003F72EE29